MPYMGDRGEWMRSLGCRTAVEKSPRTGEVVEEGAIGVQPDMRAALGDTGTDFRYSGHRIC